MEAEAGAIEQIIANLPPVDPACKQLQFSEEPQGLKRKAQGLETEEVPQTKLEDPVVPKVVEKKAPPKNKGRRVSATSTSRKTKFLEATKEACGTHQPTAAIAICEGEQAFPEKF